MISLLCLFSFCAYLDVYTLCTLCVRMRIVIVIVIGHLSCRLLVLPATTPGHVVSTQLVIPWAPGLPEDIHSFTLGPTGPGILGRPGFRGSGNCRAYTYTCIHICTRVYVAQTHHTCVYTGICIRVYMCIVCLPTTTARTTTTTTTTTTTMEGCVYMGIHRVCVAYMYTRKPHVCVNACTYTYAHMCVHVYMCARILPPCPYTVFVYMCIR